MNRPRRPKVPDGTAVEVFPKKSKALNPKDRENQMIALAVDLAEKQLREGTASSQVISHYLKRGSIKEQVEEEILREQRELIKAKTDAIKSAKKTEELYAKAIEAMRTYSGADLTEAMSDEI